jgi:hypothetical protein
MGCFEKVISSCSNFLPSLHKMYTRIKPVAHMQIRLMRPFVATFENSYYHTYSGNLFLSYATVLSKVKLKNSAIFSVVVSPFSRKMVKDGTLATNGLITLL